MSKQKYNFDADYVPSALPSHYVPVNSIFGIKRKPSQRIFVNRSLHLENIKYYGFDMDYTIAEYCSPQYENLIFDLGKDQLVKMGYPGDILEFQYDPSFPVRGLWYDVLYGNLLKVDAYGNILICVHGFDYLKGPEIQELYPNKFLQFDEQRVYVLNTLFHLPEMYLLACLMDYFSNSIMYEPEGCTAVKAGDLVISYKSVYQDVRTAINFVHTRGALKQKTVENLPHYIKKHENIPLAFNNIRASGAKVFLLTNSDFKYTNDVMTYLFDFTTKGETHRDWTTYFDIIICDACKPQFFEEGTVLRQVDKTTGELNLGRHMGPLKQGQVYSGGSCEVFMNLINSMGRDVLYFGDHIFGDILKSKKICGWRTFLIVPELIRELHVWTDKCQLFTELQSFDVVLGEMYKDMDSSAKEKPDITNIRAAIREVTHRMDLSYGMLGSVFRSGSRQTAFSDQVVRYADLYAATFTNIIYYPLSYMFRAPAMLMPHESTVAHEQRFQMEPIISRQRTPSMERTYHKSLMRVHSVVPNIMPSVPKSVIHTHDDDDDAALDGVDNNDIVDIRKKISEWESNSDIRESIKKWDEDDVQPKRGREPTIKFHSSVGQSSLSEMSQKPDDISSHNADEVSHSTCRASMRESLTPSTICMEEKDSFEEQTQPDDNKSLQEVQPRSVQLVTPSSSQQELRSSLKKTPEMKIDIPLEEEALSPPEEEVSSPSEEEVSLPPEEAVTPMPASEVLLVREEKLSPASADESTPPEEQASVPPLERRCQAGEHEEPTENQCRANKNK